jgi:hypothetical protein
VGEAPDARPTSEHSESSRYASYRPKITFFGLKDKDRSDKLHGR